MGDTIVMPTDIRLRVGVNVNKLRKPRSQETVSGLIGCSRKHLIEIEHGIIDVGIVMLEKIATALDVEIAELLK